VIEMRKPNRSFRIGYFVYQEMRRLKEDVLPDGTWEEFFELLMHYFDAEGCVKDLQVASILTGR